jgi:hypothetical protein
LQPALFSHTIEDSVYPGSLTTLADGRVVHAWNVWFPVEDKARSRHVAFSINSDDGITWSEPRSLNNNKDPRIHVSVGRIPSAVSTGASWLSIATSEP